MQVLYHIIWNPKLFEQLGVPKIKFLQKNWALGTVDDGQHAQFKCILSKIEMFISDTDVKIVVNFLNADLKAKISQRKVVSKLNNTIEAAEQPNSTFRYQLRQRFEFENGLSHKVFNNVCLATFIFSHSVSWFQTHLDERKQFLLWYCRSTPARHAASPYQYERHPNAQNKLKH